MLSYFIWAIIAYIVYRFIVGFVWPIYKTTRQIKKQFNTMRDKAAEMQDRFAQTTTNDSQRPTSPSPSASKPKKDDYLDFEEIKD
jgi:type II secretory pathway component PulM